MNKYKKAVMMIGLLFSSHCLYAQYEPMFTQYSFNEMFINPAYAGSHDALSVSALYRRQWVNIEGAPTTQSLTMHTPLNKDKVGVGLSFYSDQIGVTQQIGAYANYAFRMKFNSGVLALGVLAGVDGLQERLLEIRTTDGADQQFAANTPMMLAPNFGAGGYYSNNKFYLGVSVPRLLSNNLYINDQNQLTNIETSFNVEDLHYFVATGYVMTINPVLKVRPSIMLKAVVNAPVEYDANGAIILYNSLWLGVGYRSGDAINGLVAIQPSPQFRIGYSYDRSFSRLEAFNSGSHEVSLNYIFNFNKKKITSPRYF